MANICTTEVRIYGDSDSIKKLVDAYNRAEQQSEHKYSVDIADLCNECGIPTEGRDCRSGIDYFSYDERGYSSIDMTINGKWTPPYWFLAALDDSDDFPNMGVSFMAEELGCEIYESNDIGMFSDCKYYLCADCCDEPYFSSKDDIEEFVEENELDEDDYTIYELKDVNINGEAA